MQTAEQIRQNAIARRTTLGLKLRILTPDGATTMYPKDHATKQAWITAARRKGYTVVEVA
jgi:hypothetical protein